MLQKFNPGILVLLISCLAAGAQVPSPPAKAVPDAADPNDPNRFAVNLPDFQKLGTRLEELLKKQPEDPGIPNLLHESIMAATLVGRKEIAEKMREILYLKYPKSLQAAYLRKTGGWGGLFQIFQTRIVDGQNPLEPADMDRMKQVMAMMIKENGVDWSEETVLFYAVLFGFPAGDSKNLTQTLSLRKSPVSRATRILFQKDLTAKDKLLDLSEFPRQPTLRGLERYYHKFDLTEEQRQSKLVGMAMGRGYLEQCRFDKAREILASLAKETDDPETRFYLAWALGLEKKYEEGKQQIALMEGKKMPPTLKESSELLLEGLQDEKDSVLQVRADLTRTLSSLTRNLPKSFGVQVRLIDAKQGDRVLLFHCDTAQDTFHLAISQKGKPLLVYRTDLQGTRIYFEGDKDIRENPLPGIVPIFSLEPNGTGLHYQYQSRFRGSHATADSLEKMAKQSWFVPAFLADFLVNHFHSWGWLSLAPVETDDEETLVWVRPSLRDHSMEKYEIVLDARNRPKTLHYAGQYRVDFLNFDGETSAKDKVEALWPSLPINRQPNHSPIDTKRFQTVFEEFQNLPIDPGSPSPQGSPP